MGRRSKKPDPRKPRRERSANRGVEPPELKRARSLWRNGHFDRALELFDTAVRCAPTSIAVLVDASRAYADRHRIDRATALLEAAKKLSGRNPQAWFVVGESYRMAGLHGQAERCYRETLRLAERAPQAQLELAALCERRGRINEARELVDRLLRDHCGHAPAMVLKGRVLRRQSENEVAEATLRQVTDSSGLPPSLRAEAYGELAELYDQADRRDEAWTAILCCKELQRPAAGPALAAANIVRERFERLHAALSADDFRQWDAEAPSPSPRLALLTGFPRSGTTLLEQVLDAHPGIRSCEERDILATPTLQALHAGAPPIVEVTELLLRPAEGALDSARRIYLEILTSALGDGVDGKTLLDKNPALTPMVPVYLRLFPAAKVIVALRDPRDVLLSCFLRCLPLNPVSVNFLSPELTAKKLASDLEGWLRLRELIPGRYVEVRYEDLVESLMGGVQGLLEFLELPWDESVLNYRERRDRVVLSPSYAAVSQPIYRSAIGRWRRYETQLEPVLDQVSRLATRLGYS